MASLSQISKFSLVFFIIGLSTLYLNPYQESEAQRNLIPTQNKVSQDLPNQYVEEFDRGIWADRYDTANSDGTYSNWTATNSNGLYTFQKQESASIRTAETINITGNYDVGLTCNSTTYGFNNLCNNNNLNLRDLGAVASWLSGYGYRKAKIINGSTTGFDSNYILVLNLFYASGVDSNRNLYFNGTIQTNFADVRFTDSANTPLNYFLDNIVTGVSATAFVEVAVAGYPSTTGMFVYYSNPAASSASNGYTTFNFFDDFEAYTVADDICSGWWNCVKANTGTGSTYASLVVTDPLESDQAVYLEAKNGASNANFYLTTNTTITQHQQTFFSFDVIKVKHDDIFWITTDNDVTPNNGFSSVTQFNDTNNEFRWLDYDDSTYQPFSPVLTTSALTVGVWYSFLDHYFTVNQTQTITVDSTNYVSDADPLTGDTTALELILFDQETSADLYEGWYLDNVYAYSLFTHDPEVYTNTTETTLANLEHIGNHNQTDSTLGDYTNYGITRLFPTFNLTVLAESQALGATPTTFETFNLTLPLSDIVLTESLDFFVYEISDSSTYLETTGSYTQAQLGTFWNLTSIPLTTVSVELGDIPSDYVFDLIDLGDYFLTNKLTDNTLFGLGIQVASADILASTDLVTTPANLALYYEIAVPISDTTYRDISTSINSNDAFLVSTDLIFSQADSATWSTSENQLQIQLAIETTNGTVLTPTYFIRLLLYGTGAVYLQWSDVSGNTQTKSLGYTLTANKGYRITFNVDRSSSTFRTSITNSTGHTVLTPTSWQSTIANEQTHRPNFFTASPLGAYWRSDTTPAHRRGYLLTFNATSTYVVTGQTSWSLDRVFANNGLLDESWTCSIGAGYTTDCIAGTATSNALEREPFALSYNVSTNGTTQSFSSQTIRDFRALSGRLHISNEQYLSTDVIFLLLQIYIVPKYRNGTDGALLYGQLSFVEQPATSSHKINALFSDNVTYDVDFGNSAWDGSSAPSDFDVGVGVYWTETPGQLALEAKMFDQTQNAPVSSVTYGNYDPDLISDDVNIELRYSMTIDAGVSNELTGTMGLAEKQIVRGATIPFFKPDIPDPQFEWIPPPDAGFFGPIFAVLDDLGNGLTGIFNDPLGFVVDLINFILSIPGTIINLLLSTFSDWVIPTVQGWIYGILVFFLGQTIADQIWFLNISDGISAFEFVVLGIFSLQLAIFLVILFYCNFMPYAETQFDLFEGSGHWIDRNISGHVTLFGNEIPLPWLLIQSILIILNIAYISPYLVLPT